MVVTLCVVNFWLPNVIMYTDKAYVDMLTGSHRGHRQWRWGKEIGHWQWTSPLETFLSRQSAQGHQPKWVSYAGTSHGVLGTVLTHGHGNPGVVLSLRIEVLTLFCHQASD
jgi:hypothetical protein